MLKKSRLYPIPKVLTVTSGKGGVAKSTSAVAIAVGLALLNKKTVVIDFDIGLKKLDLIMGCEEQSKGYNIIDVINGKASLEDALICDLYKDKCGSNLSLLPTSDDHDKTALRDAGVKKIIDELKDMGYEYIICDSPAGIESGSIHALAYADEVIIVTNPELQSIKDSIKMVSEIQKHSVKYKQKIPQRVKRHLLITKYNEKLVRQKASMSYKDILSLVENDNFLGTITDSSYDILTASNMGKPVVLLDKPKSNIVNDYKQVVQILLGNDVYKPKQQGFFSRLLG